MRRYRDIRQLQKILLIRRLIAYLLVLRYIQALKGADTYNSGNQLISENGVSYAYDQNGNLTKKTEMDSGKVWLYTYDYENRLIKVIKHEDNEAVVVSFKHDPFGRRIEKKVEGNDGIKTYNYIYDNEDILFEYDANGYIGNRYIHGLGIDEPLAMIDGKNTYYYHADGLGSIIALTDSRGSTVQTYEYDSFGNLKDQKNRVKQPYTFTGREWDKEIGLYYYRARYYDAEAGRFTTVDPVLHNSVSNCSFKKILLNPQRLNPFIYSLNSPIVLSDPAGEFPWYGNYCGPGNNYPAQPIDVLDAACKVHDDCYTAAGLSARDVIIPPKNPSQCNAQDACDDALCSDARSFNARTLKQRLARSTVMKIFCD